MFACNYELYKDKQLKYKMYKARVPIEFPLIINAAKIMHGLIAVLFFVVLIDPTGSLFHAKEIVFGITFLYAIVYMLLYDKKVSIYSVIIPLAMVALPFLGIILANAFGSYDNPEFALGQIKALMFSFLLPAFCLVEGEILKKIVARIGLCIACIIFACYLVGLIDPASFAKLYVFMVEEKDLAIISVRQFLGLPIVAIFYRTAPVILFAMSYYLYNEKKGYKLFATISFLGLLFTGSRTPMLAALSLFLLYLADRVKNTRIKVILFVLMSSALIVLVLLLLGETTEESNMVKFGNVLSYFEALSNTPDLIFGEGLGSTFYAMGRSEWVTHSELTYLDLIRIYGLPVALIFISIVFYPVLYAFTKKMELTYNRYFVAYTLYMVVAGTNPLLLSSTGMCVFCLGWALVLKLENKKMK